MGNCWGFIARLFSRTRNRQFNHVNVMIPPPRATSQPDWYGVQKESPSSRQTKTKNYNHASTRIIPNRNKSIWPNQKVNKSDNKLPNPPMERKILELNKKKQGIHPSSASKNKAGRSKQTMEGRQDIQDRKFEENVRRPKTENEARSAKTELKYRKVQKSPQIQSKSAKDLINLSTEVMERTNNMPLRSKSEEILKYHDGSQTDNYQHKSSEGNNEINTRTVIDIANQVTKPDLFSQLTNDPALPGTQVERRELYKQPENGTVNFYVSKSQKVATSTRYETKDYSQRNSAVSNVSQGISTISSEPERQDYTLSISEEDKDENIASEIMIKDTNFYSEEPLIEGNQTYSGPLIIDHQTAVAKITASTDRHADLPLPTKRHQLETDQETVAKKICLPDDVTTSTKSDNVFVTKTLDTTDIATNEIDLSQLNEKELNIYNKIKMLSEQSKDFEKLAKEFVGKVGSQEHYYIDESLARLLLDLDDLGVLKNDQLRLERRKVIRYIYALLDILVERAES